MALARSPAIGPSAIRTRSGVVPSLRSIATNAPNAVVESFWGRMQTELPNRNRWKTRIELANAMFAYLVVHNRQPRHFAVAMRTPIEFELLHQPPNPRPETQPTPGNQGP